uniref:Thioredoxin, mitochondrial n=2 Tax=Cacopsylla melanoneura TaxID=428564 RepID=A0A8D8TXG6_9HEMI
MSTVENTTNTFNEMMTCNNNLQQKNDKDSTVVKSSRPPSRTSNRNQESPTGKRDKSGVNACFHIQDRQDFETKVEKASTPVIIDFHATWCDPCKTLAPRLETLIQRMNGKVQLAKVDIDEMTDLAMDYNISSVPVLIKMKDGKEQDRMVGLQNTARLEAFIESSSSEDDETNDKEEQNAD